MLGTWTHLAELNSVSVRSSSPQVWQEYVELGSKTDFLQGIGLQGYNPTQTWLVRLPPNTKATRTIKLSCFYTTKWYVCPLSKIKKAYLCKDKKIQTSQLNVEETIQTKPKNKQKPKKLKFPHRQKMTTLWYLCGFCIPILKTVNSQKREMYWSPPKFLLCWRLSCHSFCNELHRLCPAQQAED